MERGTTSHPPVAFSKAYCPRHGDVTGQTHYGIGVGRTEEQEWCRCGWAVERVRYVREEADR